MRNAKLLLFTPSQRDHLLTQVQGIQEQLENLQSGFDAGEDGPSLLKTIAGCQESIRKLMLEIFESHLKSDFQGSNEALTSKQKKTLEEVTRLMREYAFKKN